MVENVLGCEFQSLSALLCTAHSSNALWYSTMYSHRTLDRTLQYCTRINTDVIVMASCTVHKNASKPWTFTAHGFVL